MNKLSETFQHNNTKKKWINIQIPDKKTNLPLFVHCISVYKSGIFTPNAIGFNPVEEVVEAFPETGPSVAAAAIVEVVGPSTFADQPYQLAVEVVCLSSEACLKVAAEC